MYIAQSTWGMMGRREERKRLANIEFTAGKPAYKMAAFEMTDSTIDTNSFPRPIHSAFQAKKSFVLKTNAPKSNYSLKPNINSRCQKYESS